MIWLERNAVRLWTISTIIDLCASAVVTPDTNATHRYEDVAVGYGQARASTLREVGAQPA